MNVLVSGFELLEGPVWHPKLGLMFADAGKGGAYRLGKNGDVTTIFEHRRGIGGMVWHETEGLIMSGRNIAYKGPAAKGTAVIIEKDPDNGIVGFNDITTDHSGRIYAGALGFVPTETGLSGNEVPSKGAPLFLIELDGSIRQVQADIKLTNGLGFSPDGRTLYHADSGERTVYQYTVEPNGSLTARRTFISVAEGLPDGLAVDSSGAVWVAIAHSGVVLVFDANGELKQQFRFPIAMVTSLCFGGSDMCDVYVMSGSDGSGRDDAGTVFALRSNVPGLSVSPARIRLPGEG